MHFFDDVVPVDHNVPASANPLVHEDRILEDFKLLFLGLSFQNVRDVDEMLSGLNKAQIGLDFLVRKMILGTVAQGAFTEVFAGCKAAFLGLTTDGAALLLSDPGIQVQGALGTGFLDFFLHID